MGNKVLIFFVGAIAGIMIFNALSQKKEVKIEVVIEKVEVIMQENFEPGFENVLILEGGYVNHPDDPGGETNMGITAKTLKKYITSSTLVKYNEDMSVKDITIDIAREIYRQYWNISGCNELPCQIDTFHFDTAIHCGVITAGKMLQESVNKMSDKQIKVDGYIGKITIEAVNNLNYADLKEVYKLRRLEYYAELIKKKPNLKVFLKGWVKRVRSL